MHVPAAACSNSLTRTLARLQPPRTQAYIQDLPVDKIRRPLARTRANDQEKVAWLMASISEIGLQEPIDVLEVRAVLCCVALLVLILLPD
jgi:hypothetical protein